MRSMTSKMLYGWIAARTRKRVDDTNARRLQGRRSTSAAKMTIAMTTGWLQLDIYTINNNDDYERTAAFNDDEDQTRSVSTSSPMVRFALEDGSKRPRIRLSMAKKYAFDQYGAMVAEWSLDEDDLN